MADNVAISAGSGTNIATDEVTGTGEHVQVVKLAIATDGSRTPVPADGTDGLLVNLGANNDVAATLAAETTKVIGTVNVAAGQTIAVSQGTAASLNCTEASASAIRTAVELIDDAVFADDAGFTVGTSKVMAAGFMADETSTDVVNEGDVGIARMTLDRRQIVQVGESGEKDVVGGGSKTDTSDQSIMVAGGAGVYNVLSWLCVYNASATNTYATLKDGSTTRAIIPLPAYGGAVFMPPRGIRGTANTAWNVAAGASVTTAYFYGGGYTCQS